MEPQWHPEPKSHYGADLWALLLCAGTPVGMAEECSTLERPMPASLQHLPTAVLPGGAPNRWDQVGCGRVGGGRVLNTGAAGMHCSCLLRCVCLLLLPLLMLPLSLRSWHGNDPHR